MVEFSGFSGARRQCIATDSLCFRNVEVAEGAEGSESFPVSHCTELTAQPIEYHTCPFGSVQEYTDCGNVAEIVEGIGEANRGSRAIYRPAKFQVQ